MAREISRHTLRIQKTLEDADLKITGLITDILGLSGRSLLDAIASGQHDPERLADMAWVRLKAKHDRLVEALRGVITDHTDS